MAWIGVDQMRAELIKVHPGQLNWMFKVIDMPDEQVAAIYKRMLKAGELKKDPVVVKKSDIPERGDRAKDKFFDEYCGEQLRFDI